MRDAPNSDISVSELGAMRLNRIFHFAQLLQCQSTAEEVTLVPIDRAGILPPGPRITAGVTDDAHTTCPFCAVSWQCYLLYDLAHRRCTAWEQANQG